MRHRTATARLLALLAALTLLAAACSDDGDDSSSDDGGASDEAQTEPVATDEVSIANISYDPSEIQVSAGDTVTWVNDEGIAHTVTAGTPDDSQPDEFDSGNLQQGDTFEQTFDEAGEIAFYCTIHPTQMQGTVFVE